MDKSPTKQISYCLLLFLSLLCELGQSTLNKKMFRYYSIYFPLSGPDLLNFLNQISEKFKEFLKQKQYYTFNLSADVLRQEIAFEACDYKPKIPFQCKIKFTSSFLFSCFKTYNLLSAHAPNKDENLVRKTFYLSSFLKPHGYGFRARKQTNFFNK